MGKSNIISGCLYTCGNVINDMIDEKKEERSKIFNNEKATTLDFIRSKKLLKQIALLNEDLTLLTNFGVNYQNILDKINLIDAKLKSTSDDLTKEGLEELKEIAIQKMNEIVNSLEGLMDKYVPTDGKVKVKEVKESTSTIKAKVKKISNMDLKKKIAATVVTLGLITGLVCLLKSCSNDLNTPLTLVETNMLSADSRKRQGPEIVGYGSADKSDDEGIIIDTLETGDVIKFTDIYDDKQVQEVVEQFYKDVLDMNPEFLSKHDLTEEKFKSELTDAINYINGGAVRVSEKEYNVLSEANGGKPVVTIDKVVGMINMLGNIMNDESVYAANKHNDIVLPDEENEKVINWTELFVDDTRGEKLVQKIENVRDGLITDNKSVSAKKEAKEFMRLLCESWLLNGANNEISAYGLEKNGMEFFVDKYFLNTAYLVDQAFEKEDIIYSRDIEINGEKTKETHELREVLDTINEANCEVENGQFVNKFSADMFGVVNETKVLKLGGK